MGILRAMLRVGAFVLALALCAVATAHEEGPDKLALHAEHFPHAQGSRAAIYQFQIDMDVENAYYFNEKSQSKPGTPAQKGNCKVGQRSPQSQAQIRKKFPGARITFPKLVRCNVNSIHDFVTVYVHAKAAKHVKEIPMDDMIKASYSQNNELKESGGSLGRSQPQK